jgi:hypothetical protein
MCYNYSMKKKLKRLLKDCDEAIIDFIDDYKTCGENYEISLYDIRVYPSEVDCGYYYIEDLAQLLCLFDKKQINEARKRWKKLLSETKKGK